MTKSSQARATSSGVSPATMCTRRDAFISRFTPPSGSLCVAAHRDSARISTSASASMCATAVLLAAGGIGGGGSVAAGMELWATGDQSSERSSRG